VTFTSRQLVDSLPFALFLVAVLAFIAFDAWRITRRARSCPTCDHRAQEIARLRARNERLKADLRFLEDALLTTQPTMEDDPPDLEAWRKADAEVASLNAAVSLDAYRGRRDDPTRPAA
jgi:hypothetical protein